jgi:hypothetical protein
MPESTVHMKLVCSLVSWISSEFFAGQQGTVLVDSPENPATAKPALINGFVPDVFGRGLPGGAVVIGEAKTAGDVDNRHTRAQIAAFLQYCAAMQGSVFVFAVPWHKTRFARNLIRNIERTSQFGHVSSVILEQLEG